MLQGISLVVSFIFQRSLWSNSISNGGELKCKVSFEAEERIQSKKIPHLVSSCVKESLSYFRMLSFKALKCFL